MDFDPNGNLHVMIRDSAVASVVIAIAPDGTGLGKSINDLPIDSGQDVVVGMVAGNLLATAANYTSIRQFDASGDTGGFQWPQIANFGPDPGPSFAIQKGSDGNLYGLGQSGGNDTLFKLDGSTGNVLLSENIAGHGSGLPRSLTFDDDGNVFVGRGWNGTPNVHRYDSDLNHLGEYVSSGLFGDNSGISLAHNVIPEPSVLTVLSLGLIGLVRRGRA